MAEPPLSEHQKLIENLERRAYITYKCRLRAFYRLSRLSNWWNSSLIAFATSTTIASVGLLVDREMYGRGGDLLMVALSILSLVASLVASSVGYSGRAKAMEASYKEIQRIALDAEMLKSHDKDGATWLKFLELHQQYASTVGFSENHTDGDYRRMLSTSKEGKGSWIRERLVTLIPLATLALPIVLLIPLGYWFAQ